MHRHFKPISAYIVLKIYILEDLYTVLFISLEKSSFILFEQLLMQIPVGRKAEEHGVTPRIRNKDIVPLLSTVYPRLKDQSKTCD